MQSLNGPGRRTAWLADRPRLSHYYGSGWLLTDSITHVRPPGEDAPLYDYLDAGGTSAMSWETIRKEPALVKFVCDLTSQPAAACAA